MHGAMVKRCSHKGCSDISQQGGVCIRYGARRKPNPHGRHEGCTNYIKREGVCKSMARTRMEATWIAISRPQ
jgi:hypothetical protein